MFHCIKCKHLMFFFDGSSVSSGISFDPSAQKVKGYSCRNCGAWQEIPVYVPPSRFKPNNLMKGPSRRGMTGAEYGQKLKAEVLPHFEQISALRASGKTYKAIVADLGLGMSSTTCERYMTQIQRERGINGYVYRGIGVSDHTTGVLTRGSDESHKTGNVGVHDKKSRRRTKRGPSRRLGYEGAVP